jgi:hypothetical protein
MSNGPDLSELSAAVTRIRETYSKDLHGLGRQSDAEQEPREVQAPVLLDCSAAMSGRGG